MISHQNLPRIVVVPVSDRPETLIVTSRLTVLVSTAIDLSFDKVKRMFDRVINMF